MPLPAKAFQHWLHGVAPNASTADICRISGIKRTTLAQQLVRGKVAETTLVSISRALKRSPLADLASFDSYQELAGAAAAAHPRRTGQPDCHHGPAAGRHFPLGPGVRRLRRRRQRGDAGARPRTARHLGPELGGRDRRRRTAAPGVGRHRRRAAELFGPVDRQPAVPGAGGRDRPRRRRRIHGRTRRHRPAHRGTRPAGRRRPRQAALDALSDGELTALAGERLQALGKTLRRQEHEHEQTKKIWENLG